jgi:tellurite resistance protein TerC
MSGIRIFFSNDSEKNYKNSYILKLFNKFLPFTYKLHNENFFVRTGKTVYATPLFAVLLLVEFSDILFAIDSIPAIFSVTKNQFLIYSSNVFAILGLRNMYFVLEKVQKLFIFVKYGVALILIFTGAKLSLLFFQIEIHIMASISIIVSILVLSIICSTIYSFYNNRLDKYNKNIA